jgi:hypothetical protein
MKICPPPIVKRNLDIPLSLTGTHRGFVNSSPRVWDCSSPLDPALFVANPWRKVASRSPWSVRELDSCVCMYVCVDVMYMYVCRYTCTNLHQAPEWDGMKHLSPYRPLVMDAALVMFHDWVDKAQKIVLLYGVAAFASSKPGLPQQPNAPVLLRCGVP